MEDVSRMTHNDLFLFKKTLEETGQIALANSVPVDILPLASTATAGQYIDGHHTLQ